MATLPLTYYRASCDACGSGFDDPCGEGIVAWEFPSDAVLAATEIGWRYTDGHLTCPACLRCDICGEQPAWVGGPDLGKRDRIRCEDCDPPGIPEPPVRVLPGLDRRLAVVPEGSTGGT